jgi:hypothetical protein
VAIRRTPNDRRHIQTILNLSVWQRPHRMQVRCEAMTRKTPNIMDLRCLVGRLTSQHDEAIDPETIHRRPVSPALPARRVEPERLFALDPHSPRPSGVSVSLALGAWGALGGLSCRKHNSFWSYQLWSYWGSFPPMTCSRQP